MARVWTHSQHIPIPKALPVPLLKENIGKDVSGQHPMDPRNLVNPDFEFVGMVGVV